MKTHFDEAIGTVPASTLDVDTLIARGRRGAAYRRMGMSAAGLGAVAVLVAVVLGTGALDGVVASGRPAPVGGPAGPVSSPAPGKAPPAVSMESVAQTERRLTLVLQRHIKEKLPAARLSSVAPPWKPLEARHVYQQGKKPDSTGRGTAPADYFQAMAMLNDRNTTGRFLLTTGVIGPAFQVRTTCDDLIATSRASRNTRVTSCTVDVGPHGEVVLRVSQNAEPGSDNPNARLHSVHIRRTDGTGVELQANSTRDSNIRSTVRPDTPVLSLDQLEEIGTDPALQLSR